VRVTLEETEGELPIRIRIEDQGPGVPPENLETVFERFYTSRPKGAAFGSNSGLGLSIVRQIVEAHGGRAWAENMTEGDRILGARFVVALPANGRRP
jgi:two-component system sensor histidine kinase ChvG